MSNDMRDIEAEIEATRERLAQTIDQLAYRSNPKVIANRQVAAVKGHYVDAQTGAPRTDNILKTAGIVGGVVVAFVALRVISRRRG